MFRGKRLGRSDRAAKLTLTLTAWPITRYVSKFLGLTALMIVSGCGSHDPCAAWRKPPAPNDAPALVKNERRIAEYLAAQDKAGAEIGCW